jgi:hypothetical protein
VERLGGQPMSETDQKRVRLAGRDNLFPWYALTALYLGLGALVLYDRWSEVGSLLEPPGANTGRLPLNSIGDILAGFFAPLAFLWLFVATQLQRKELRLQREELADTRAVLADQKAELQKSAAESNLQTSIMQKNLNYSESKERYGEFSLGLYYAARGIYTDQHTYIQIEEKRDSSSDDWGHFDYPVTAFKPQIHLSPTDPSTVDVFFDEFSSAISQAVTYLSDDKHRISLRTDQSWVFNKVDFVLFSIPRLLEIDYYKGNTLIELRKSSLNLEPLVENCKFLNAEFLKETNAEMAQAR